MPTQPARRTVLILAVLAALEIATLAVLLVNVFTAHLRPLTQTMGPTHGAIYLVIVVIMLFAPGFRPTQRLLGLLPVVGGAIALLSIARSRDNREPK